MASNSIQVPDRHVAKRQRRTELSNTGPDRTTEPRNASSRLFAPYRTIGLVSPTAVPFTYLPLGKTTFQITTSIGNALQTYDLKRGLHLVFITRPQTPGLITATLAWKDLVFAAWSRQTQNGAERGLWAYKRGKRVAELKEPRGITEDIRTITTFGTWIVACGHSRLYVWTTSTFEYYTALQGSSHTTFTGALTTLPTLLDKLLVGKQDGAIELWNVSSGRLIHTFMPHLPGCGAVTVLEAAPVLHTVAIGYESGTVSLHDVRTDKAILTLDASHGGAAVDSITFRTDGLGAGEEGRLPGVMATSSRSSGDITMWDLNNGGRKSGVLRGAHASPSSAAPGGVTRVSFLPGQAIMISSGLDNSLKSWIFDETPFSAIPRPLHNRSGHGGHVTSLSFLPSASDGSDISGKWLMAGSKDRSLWGWSLRRDGQSSELSQGAIEKKAKKMGLLSSANNHDKLQDLKVPPITSIACSLNRDGGMNTIPGKQPIWQDPSQRRAVPNATESSSMTGWESIVTVHETEIYARTWFWGRKRAGRWKLPSGDRTPVMSAAISPCGTFAVIGSSAGGIDMFNLQSGQHRRRFPPRLTPKQAQQLKSTLAIDNEADMTDVQRYHLGQGKHTAAVTGLAVDNLNQTLISCSANGQVKFWDFKTGKLIHELDWRKSVAIDGLCLHRSTELVALRCADGAVRVVDTVSHKVVRDLPVSRDQNNPQYRCKFSDVVFSEDGRWIAASSADLVFVWDLPTGQLIDAVRLADQCTAISFSPTGEYLATADAGSVGINIWSNRTLFTHVPVRRLAEEDLLAIMTSENVAQPTASGEHSEQLLDAPESQPQEDDLDLMHLLDDSKDIDKISSDLVSLSLVPRSQWQNLLHMDVIRARNKPTEAPKKPETAPFFLPSLHDKKSKKDESALITNGQGSEVAIIDMERSRIARIDSSTTRSNFSQSLQSAQSTDDYKPFIEQLKTLSPAAADIELRSLSSDSTSAYGSEMLGFVNALTWVLGSRRDFELGQTWMAVFLRLHSDVVIRDATVRQAVAEWRELLTTEKKRVASLTEYCSGLVEYLRAARV